MDKKSMNLSSNGSLNNVLNKFLCLVPFCKKERGKSLNNWVIRRKRLKHQTVGSKSSEILALFHFRTINGESASVDNSTMEEWAQRLSTILDGFNENDVFNADETGLVYRATPDRSLVLSKEECKGGKKNKERLTVLLCLNWTETEKSKAVVIGKSMFID